MKDEDLAACHCALEALHLLPPPPLLLLSINSNQLIEWPCAEREREITRGLSFCLLSLGRFYSSSSHFISFPFLSPLISVIDSSQCAHNSFWQQHPLCLLSFCSFLRVPCSTIWTQPSALDSENMGLFTTSSSSSMTQMINFRCWNVCLGRMALSSSFLLFCLVFS